MFRVVRKVPWVFHDMNWVLDEVLWLSDNVD